MTEAEKKEYQKQWYLKNKQLLSDKHKKYYIENKNTINDNAKKHYSNNKESILKKHKEYRIINRESLNKKHREYMKKYLEVNREKINKNKKSRYSQNKELHFADQIKRRYGISLQQYNELFKKQDGKCAICARHQNILKVKLSIDHCHKSKIIRGLLCFRCNAAIGQLNDDINLFKKAIYYLNKYSK